VDTQETRQGSPSLIKPDGVGRKGLRILCIMSLSPLLPPANQETYDLPHGEL
jgi:hypothetical protein